MEEGRTGSTSVSLNVELPSSILCVAIVPTRRSVGSTVSFLWEYDYPRKVGGRICAGYVYEEEIDE